MDVVLKTVCLHLQVEEKCASSCRLLALVCSCSVQRYRIVYTIKYFGFTSLSSQCVTELVFIIQTVAVVKQAEVTVHFLLYICYDFDLLE